MAVAFFDVDGTLIRGSSSERRFIRQLLLSGRLGPRQLGHALLFYLRWGRQYGRHTGKRNKAYLAGLPVADIEAAATKLVAEDLVYRLRRTILQRLAEHRERGDTVVLLTGAPSFIAGPLADLVEADTWIGTRCAVRNGRFLPAPPVDHPFGAEKVRLAERHCRSLGTTLEHAAAYGDSFYDLPLLTRVGTPVAVAPDAALRRAAQKMGWEILDGGRSRRGIAAWTRQIEESKPNWFKQRNVVLAAEPEASEHCTRPHRHAAISAPQKGTAGVRWVPDRGPARQ